MIGILGAMQAEVDGLVRELKDHEEKTVMGHTYHLGKLGSREVVVARCGVGKVNAAVCAQTMLLTFRPEALINTGVAGSLSDRLDILDVAVATDAVQHDYDTTGMGEPVGALSIDGRLVTTLPCDAAWRDRLLKAAEAVGVKAVPARVASGDQFITSRDAKRRIVETFAAEACEMEGAAIAQACYLAGVPCAILRAISDSTDDDHFMEYTEFLPKAVERTHRILMEVVK
ncbi:MAG: 5'-methylthioadenosine/adenosylhomocysteine nucleosidase [Clostridia bacterium]|nr:5'-methylthioadenosine/adenosylhomocysteine nucleosidase [Clostridia bacterium]